LHNVQYNNERDEIEFNHMENKEKLLLLDNAGVSAGRKDILKNLNLDVYRGDVIGIYGLNGSGKSLLAELLAGRLQPVRGSYLPSEGVTAAVVSSAEQLKMLEEERHNDDSEFMGGKTDPGRSVHDIFVQNAGACFSEGEEARLSGMFGIAHIIDRGIKFLSTGEFRKIMMVNALLLKPDILVLDDPYTGLDLGTRRNLEIILKQLASQIPSLIVISGRFEDLRQSGRFLFLDRMMLAEYGSIEDIKAELKNRAPVLSHDTEIDAVGGAFRTDAGSTPLIEMHNVNMSYYDTKVLTGIDWTVKPGEHWQVSGPNGSGKSSLLSLVTGDSPKAYGQNISLFGRKRGSGETVWEIKQKIGYVSGSLQQLHRTRQNVLSVVVSGFFDTVGLYDRPDAVQIEKARGWCHEFGMNDYLDKSFSGLSEGLKRAVLIIRAIVKRPEILILDEPCQGLDDYNSEFVLSVANNVIKRDHSTLIYVSHDPDYIMKEINNRLELVAHPGGGYTGNIG